MGNSAQELVTCYNQSSWEMKAGGSQDSKPVAKTETKMEEEGEEEGEGEEYYHVYSI